MKIRAGLRHRSGNSRGQTTKVGGNCSVEDVYEGENSDRIDGTIPPEADILYKKVDSVKAEVGRRVGKSRRMLCRHHSGVAKRFLRWVLVILRS